MTAPPSFAVIGSLHDLLGNVVGSALAENGLGGATPATVTLSSNIHPYPVVVWEGRVERAKPITATVASDGTLHRNGDTVRLLANDAGLNVTGIQWRVDIGGMPSFWFDAPANGGTVDLGTVMPVPGVAAMGVTPTAGAWSGLTGVPAPLVAGGNAAGGYPVLDGGGKVAIAQLPLDIMEYKGVWNASTNSPTLVDGGGNQGDFYRVSPGGTQNLGSGSIVFVASDYILYNGSTWEKSDTTDAVASVAGLTGTISSSGLKTALGVVSKGELVLNFADYGVCDGTTNDAAAFTTVLSALSSAGGGVLQLPPKTIAMTLTAWPTFTIPGNVRIVGTPGRTTILLTSNSPTADRAFVTAGGDEVTFDGVKFVRNADFPMIFFLPGPHDGFHIDRCLTVGQHDTYPTHYAHGWDLDATGTKSNITAHLSKFTRLQYGLLQNNSITSTCDTITFSECIFTANEADDLCFNAPNSTMKNVSVLNSHFTNNASTDPTRGFGVDLAHVAGAVVDGCDFEGYGYEPIHVEDYTTDFRIIGNRIKSCGSVDGGGILVMTGCSDGVVTGNTIDATSNTNDDTAILVLQGASGTTPGGRAAIPPSNVTVAHNIIRCGAHYAGVYVENAPGNAVYANRIFGAGTVTAGVWDAGNLHAAITVDGRGTAVTDNIISGFLYGITGPGNTRVTLGDSVQSNVVSDCYVGIWGASPDNVNIHGNVMFNCVRPLIVGEAGATAKPCSVVGNSAFGCVYQMEIGGKLILNRPADVSYQYTVAPGTGQTIYVDNNLLKLPVGAAITFSPSGAVFTITTAVTTAQTNAAFPWPLIGTVTGATVGATDVGTATNLAHSTTGGNNHVALAGNTDSVAGVYTAQVRDGGTGSSTLAANSVLLGNGTSALQTVAPGASGSGLVSNGSTWVSGPAPSVDVPVAPTLYDSFTAADGTALDTGKWTVTTGGAAAAAITTNANRARFTAGATGGYNNADWAYAASTVATSLADVEVLFRQTWGTVTTEAYMYYSVRSSATDARTNSYTLAIGTLSNFYELAKYVSGTKTVLNTGVLTSFGAAATVGGVKWVRLRVKGTTVAFKIWDDGTAEPAAWSYSTTDSGVTAGGKVVAAIVGGSAAASGVNYVDQFHIYAL